MAYFKKQQETKAASGIQVRCRENNRVIIRIWTSAYNKEFPGQNVGHVSIETTQPVGYMSLWPQEEPKLQTKDHGLFKTVAHEFKRDLKEDHTAEARPAEITVCLYSLSSELLFEKWNTEKASLKGWTLIGHNRLINQSNGDSCSGLAYRLLERGGIYEQLISRGRFSSTFSSVVTPDDLGKAVCVAKQQELALHPETADFHYADETPIAPARESSTCLIL
jgi:hypothetical protein